jgi:hypothetical protein
MVRRRKGNRQSTKSAGKKRTNKMQSRSESARKGHSRRRTPPERTTRGRRERVHGKSSRKRPSVDVRERAFAAAAAGRQAESRGEKLPVPQVARQEGATVADIKRFPQLLKRTKPGQPLQFTKNDSYSRSVNIFIPLRLRDGDVRTIKVRGYKEAQLASSYGTTVGRVLRGKLPPSALDQFRGVTLGKEKYPLLTDFNKLKRLTDAGITIPEFYAKAGSAE